MSLADDLENLLTPLIESTLGMGSSSGPEQLTELTKYLQALQNPADAVGWLGQRVATLPPTAGCWVGVYLGGLVEGGTLDPALTAPGVVAFFRGAVTALGDGSNAEEWQACEGLLGPAVITQLVAHPPTLKLVSSDAELLQQLDALSASNACFYVAGLARHRSGELVVLDVPGQRALLAKYANLGCCFHLFTLLQSVLNTTWSGGRSQPAEMLAVAWGENALAQDTPGDSAWFHYSAPVPQSAIAALVPGEMLIDGITEIDGRPVLAIFPSILQERNWEAAFFGPQLNQAPPSVSIERELSQAEVSDLLAKIRA